VDGLLLGHAAGARARGRRVRTRASRQSSVESATRSALLLILQRVKWWKTSALLYEVRVPGNVATLSHAPFVSNAYTSLRTRSSFRPSGTCRRPRTVCWWRRPCARQHIANDVRSPLIADWSMATHVSEGCTPQSLDPCTAVYQQLIRQGYHYTLLAVQRHLTHDKVTTCTLDYAADHWTRGFTLLLMTETTCPGAEHTATPVLDALLQKIF
jgi:hypothetical protein